jgi:hypothetical protein
LFDFFRKVDLYRARHLNIFLLNLLSSGAELLEEFAIMESPRLFVLVDEEASHVLFIKIIELLDAAFIDLVLLFGNFLVRVLDLFIRLLTRFIITRIFIDGILVCVLKEWGFHGFHFFHGIFYRILWFGSVIASKEAFLEDTNSASEDHGREYY